MTTALIAITFLALFFVLMSVRLLLVKGGTFRGTCASQSPFLRNQGGTCGYCGRDMDHSQSCGKEEEEKRLQAEKTSA